MGIMDMAYIMFACTAANHFGLIEAMESTVRHSLPIANCPKCFTFWSILTYGLLQGSAFIHVLAISFLFSYLALWLDLALSMCDKLYVKAYEIVNTAEQQDSTSATDADSHNKDNGKVPSV